MMRAGLPATTVRGGTSWVTTLPAPTTAPSPMVTPGRTVTLPPSQTLSPMVMGRAFSVPLLRSWASEVDVGAVSDGDMGAVVAEERREDGDLAPHVADDGPEQDVPGGCLPRMQAVQFVYPVPAGIQFGKQFWIGCGIVPFAAEHFLLLSHNFVFVVG